MESEPFSKHPEWPTVLFIVETLEKRGHQAVLAGGCVRDALLGKRAKDLDVATDATPDQIESYFERVLPIGKSFGVCRVVHDGHSIEVATFRQEFDYRDGRRPTTVEYSTLEKDAERRDFTINALYYDVARKKIIDMVGGQKDLAARLLRAVGDPHRRMGEDYLRILRGVRFAGHLNFSLDSETEKAIRALAPYLARISRERIYDELNKMFLSQGRSRCLNLLMDFGILEILFADWDLEQKLKVDSAEISLRTAFERLARIAEGDSLFGWTAFYHLRTQQQSARITDKEFIDMKLPRATIESAYSIVEMGRLPEKSGDEQLLMFIALESSGHLKAAKIYWDSVNGNQHFSQASAKLEKLYLQSGKLPDPVVTGHDLIKKGWPQGPEMKKQLQMMYLEQLKSEEMDKEKLLGLLVRAR